MIGASERIVVIGGGIAGLATSVLEQGVGGLAHHLGGVEVGHRRGCAVHGVGVGVRPLAGEAEFGRLLQVHLLAGQADPFRVSLDDEQCHEHADNQGPAEESQGLEHRGESPEGCEGRGCPLRWRHYTRAPVKNESSATACEECDGHCPEHPCR